jgi:hypothetical protein
MQDKRAQVITVEHRGVVDVASSPVEPGPVPSPTGEQILSFSQLSILWAVRDDGFLSPVPPND